MRDSHVKIELLIQNVIRSIIYTIRRQKVCMLLCCDILENYSTECTHPTPTPPWNLQFDSLNLRIIICYPLIILPFVTCCDTSHSLVAVPTVNSLVENVRITISDYDFQVVRCDIKGIDVQIDEEFCRKNSDRLMRDEPG